MIKRDRLEAEAEELAESFLNGNRTYVVEGLLKMPKARGMWMALRICGMLDDDYDKQVLFKLVDRKLDD